MARVLVGSAGTGKTHIARQAIAGHTGVCWVASSHPLGDNHGDGWLLEAGRHVFSTDPVEVIGQAVTAIELRGMSDTGGGGEEPVLLVVLDDPPPALFENDDLARQFTHLLEAGPAQRVLVLLTTRDLADFPDDVQAALTTHATVRVLTAATMRLHAQQRQRLLWAAAVWFDQRYQPGDLVAIEAVAPGRRRFVARLVDETERATWT
jgi:hypothetical protein